MSTGTSHSIPWCFMPPEMHFDSPNELKEAITLFQRSRLSQSVLECTHPNMLPPKGKFECVRISSGKRILLPTAIDYAYLFRGQGQDYPKNLPTLYRSECSLEQIFLQRLKMMEFQIFLQQLPQISFFKENNYVIDYVGLAQHYGFKTDVIDLTSDIDVALFFAMCDLPIGKTEYVCKSDDKPYIGYVYCVPTFANSMKNNKIDEIFWGTRLSAIGLQPFERPGAQKGFSYKLNMGEELKSLVYSFSYTQEDSENIYRKFSQGRTLWQDDSIAKSARNINESKQFSYNAFNACVKQYGDKKKINSYKEYLRSQGYSLCKSPIYRDVSDDKDLIRAYMDKGTMVYKNDIVFRTVIKSDGTQKQCCSLEDISTLIFLGLIESGCPAPKDYMSGDDIHQGVETEPLCMTFHNPDSMQQTHPDPDSGKISKWSGDWRKELKVDLNRKKRFELKVVKHNYF